MQTLSYGVKLPETGDSGEDFFPAMEDNFTQLNDHTHNGTNSSKIAGSAVTPVTQSVLAASWSATSGGTYRQLITLPGTQTYDTSKIEVRLSTGHQILPTIEKVSSTTFYIYVNDNSLALTVLY